MNIKNSWKSKTIISYLLPFKVRKLIALSIISRFTHVSFSSFVLPVSIAERRSDSSQVDTMARDLRVNKNGTTHKIKEEVLPPPPRRFVQYTTRCNWWIDIASPFRYFCIFCKMDFLSADDFLEHLELHPNGRWIFRIDNVILILTLHSIRACTSSFVLVKRDFPPPPVSESVESEEPSSPILPEIIQNQIKIEPISEDEEDEFPSSPYQAIDPALSEAIEENVNNSHETQDPNHQLVLLSNPRIGDGPGKLLKSIKLLQYLLYYLWNQSQEIICVMSAMWVF